MAAAVVLSPRQCSGGYPSPEAIQVCSNDGELRGSNCTSGGSSSSTPSGSKSLNKSSPGSPAAAAAATGPDSPNYESDKPSSRPSTGVRLPAITVSTGGRSSSMGAIRRSAVTRAQLAITVTPAAKMEGVEVSVELKEGELDKKSSEWPLLLGSGVPTTVEYRSSGSIVGELKIAGVPPIPFGIQVGGLNASKNGERINYLSAEHRQRTVVAGAGKLELGSGMGASGDGTVVEATVSSGFSAVMTVTVRPAKKKELARLAQEQALVSAMERGKYSSLLAQVARSKMRKVPAILIEQANRMLKSIGPTEGTFLTHAELAKLMKWKKVTSPANGSSDEIVPCCASSDCSCNAGQAQDGEICDVINGVVQQALDGVAPSDKPADEWLFKALVKAALAANEGCVWKSGGKWLLSNEERNQSVTAIVNILERDNQESDAGKGIRALVDYTQREWGYRVTAVQLNFHPNQKSSHKQHRDIYGAGQKGGINCTCSFMKCTGTVCFSLGSSRQVLCETMTDKRSKYEACGDECTGQKVYKWMHSGSAMSFNDPWNNNHTHGIPKLEEACGPRISVALLCA
eukprot:TRINITY_DN34312_c0_g1_i1.p1 TRINITY_DN34312_c0_g1~~TRINITY_DN34312_c0_g1_i1.p1  ORF type:complete len:572 (-),score=105.21 TRINITY_DN34312_c0_g1_i1:96-1811(-)